MAALQPTVGQQHLVTQATVSAIRWDSFESPLAEVSQSPATRARFANDMACRQGESSIDGRILEEPKD